MAGDWIKMRDDLAEDPAVISIGARTGLDEFAVVGRLQNLWAWADRQSRDGHASGVTEQWIDTRLRCDGFARAMVDVGWLTVGKKGIDIPNFERHNGDSAKKRALGTARKAKQRAGFTQVSTDVSRTERDKSETREEKRREEKKEPQTPAGFSAFWTSWPKSTRKGGKAECLKVWVQHGLESQSTAIVAHVVAMSKTDGWTKQGGDFVPAPVVYLRGKRWDGAELAAAVAFEADIFAGAM